jgi:hypothetical protein
MLLFRYHYRLLRILLTYVKCMPKCSATARCVYTYRSTAQAEDPKHVAPNWTASYILKDSKPMNIARQYLGS